MIRSTMLRRAISVKVLLLIPILAVALYFLYIDLPIGQDWIAFFRPATLAMLHGESPYIIRDFNNPPWVLLPFIPFAIMPYQFGRLGIFIVGFTSFAYIAVKLKAKPINVILFLTSYPVVSCLYGGGLDWLPMLAFITPAPFSLIFAAIKPQVGIGIVLYWLFDSWRTGGFKLIFKRFYPLVILLAASFTLYGFWVMTSLGKWNNPVNIALFPHLIPVGGYFLYTRQKRPAMASAFCFSPYYTFYSLSAPLVALFESPSLMFIAWLVLWSYPLFNVLWG